MNDSVKTMMILAAAVAFLAIPVAARAAVEPPGQEKLDGLVLAKVNDDELTVRQMLSLFTSRHGGHAKFLGGKEEARNFLNILIEDRLLVQEAYYIGLGDDPTAVSLVREYADKKSSALLVKREVEAKAKVTKDDVAAIWKDELGAVLRVKHVALDRKRDADEVRESVAHGDDIEWFSRNCSVAPTSRNGGNLIVGWGTMPEGWERAVFALEQGAMSPVIETNEAYEVVLVVDRVDAVKPEFEQLASDIEAVLAPRKLEKRKAEFSAELWARYQVAVEPISMTPAALLEALMTTPDRVIGRWNGGQLVLGDLASADELRAWALLPQRRAEVEIENRLRMTINAPLTVLEAKRLKLAEEPELAAEIEAYEDYIVESLLYRDKIFRTLTVTDEEGHKYFDEHRDEFRQKEERHVAHILVSSEADASRVKEELAAGADFAETAKKRSRDFASAMSGGDLGWITAEKVPPSFREVLSMKPGELSKPLKSESGWHIVKVLEVKPERPLEYDEVKERLKESALDAKKREARKFWIDKLRAAATIEIYDAAIDRFVKANEMTSFDAPSPQHQVPAGELAGPRH